jgi:serine protease
MPIRSTPTPLLGALVPLALVTGAGLAAGTPGPASAGSPAVINDVGEKPFVPGEVLVRYRGERRERTYEPPPGTGVRRAARRLGRSEEVAYATPNHIAVAAGRFIPDDPGTAGVPGGWTTDQWNFLGPPGGIALPRAWGKLRDAGRGGGSRRKDRGPRIAVVDTGIAYRDDGSFAISPDFRPKQFTAGRDFVEGDASALDENGHGTHVAGTIAEQVDNGRAVTGIAYGAKLMPIRVLDADGAGQADQVRRGILWAMRHGAKVINLSLELVGVTSCDQAAGVCEAIEKARSRGVVVVAAAGNGLPDGVGDPEISFPAAVSIAVGGTTVRGCLGNYSNYGEGLDLVAPGGGRDALRLDDPACNPIAADNPEVIQLSLVDAEGGDFRTFALIEERGTSSSAAHVSAVAALVLASRVLTRGKRNVSPGRVEKRLERTARPLGDPFYYGAGLVNARQAIGQKK